MPAVSLRISFGEYKGVDDINTAVDGLGAAISDFRPFWQQVKPVIAAAFARNFEREGAISGPWPPLTPKYLARKLKQGFPPDILVRTAVLKQACTQIGDSAGPNQIMIEQEGYFGFGVMLEYSYFHDRPGGVRGKQREHLALDEQGRDEIFDAFDVWTLELVGRNWGEEAV